MCIKVFLADDSELVRNAIRTLLSSREDIAVVGEASTFYETIEKTSELHPDLIIFNVNMPARESIAPTKVKGLLNGAKVLAVSFGIDDDTRAMADNIGAAKFVDKMEISNELIPAILELAPANKRTDSV